MDQRFLAETLSRRPQLFRAMLEFNRSVTPPASPMGSAQVLNKAEDRLWARPAFRKAYSMTPQSGWWDFSEETCRLALLPPGDLYRACMFFSAAVYAEEMAKAIDKATVLALREKLGREVYEYALRRGRYQIGSLRDVLIADAALPLADRILGLAQSILEELRLNWPPGLQALFDARTDSEASATASGHGHAPLPQFTPQQRRAFWFTLKKILIREAVPQWAPCFD